MKPYFLVLAAALAAVAGRQAQAAQPNAPMTRPPTIVPYGTAGGTALTIAFIYSPEFYGIELNKGVASITSPETGVFCLTPRGTLKTAALPVVTVDWGGSSGNSLAAFVTHYLLDCTAGQIEVHTYDFTGTATDAVAFQVTVE